MRSPKLLVPAAVLAAVALAGCSTNNHEGMPGMGSTPAASSTASATPAAGPATPAAGPNNQADTTFASMMIPHHEQAILLSDMLLAKQGIDPKVTDLATRVKAAQTPEISQMRSRLSGWGQNPSPTSMGGMSGMDHSGMEGTMSQADMDKLDKATGKVATRLFLTGMVQHHRGAVAMAQTELADGQNPDAKKLARNIITTQKTEITQMTQLLSQ